MELQIVELSANISHTGSYSHLAIDESIEPQNCVAQVSIIEPYRLTRAERFNIITEQSFSFDIKLDKKIFLLNEEIYFDYGSSVSNPIITGVLTFPDGRTQNITLPSSVKASQIGVYKL